MNIYIRPDIEQELRKEASMSGLINRLLDNHYQDKREPFDLPPGIADVVINGNTKHISKYCEHAQIKGECLVKGCEK